MNSKIRYIPLVVIGAIILSLLAVMPAFGAGQVSFIDPSVINDNGTLSDSTPDEQEWGRQGGQIGLMLEDDSLDVPVRRVLIPDADTTEVGTNVDIEAQSAKLTLPRGAVAKDDYVMVGDRNVRKVKEVEAGVVQTASTADLGLTAGATTGSHTFEIDITDATKADKLTSLAVDPALPGFLKLTSMPAATGTQSLVVDGKISVIIALADNLTKNPVVVTALKTHTFTATATKADDSTLTGDKDVTIEVKPKDTDDTVTLDTPFAESDAGLAVHKINDAITDLAGVDWADNYALYAMAIRLTSTNTDDRGDYTRHNTEYLIVDSDIESTSKTAGDEFEALHRLTGGGSGRVNEKDALVITVTQATPDDDPSFVGHVLDNLDDDQVLFDLKAGADDIPIEDKLKVYLAAWFEEPNDTGSTVSVRSQAYQTSTTVVLRETGPGSGRFALKIGAVKFGTDDADDSVADEPDLSADPPTLPVNPRDVVTLSGSDSAATVTIETTKPVFTGLSPAHNTSGRASRPEVSAQVTDGDSGLTDSNIQVLFHVVETKDSTVKRAVKTPESTGDVDEISGGFEVTEQLSGIAETPDGDATISWWVMATDDAGNVGFSDRVLSEDGDPNPCTATEIPALLTDLESESECQPYVIMVDDTDPELLRAETGRNWNSGLVTGDSDDKTEYRVSKAAKDVVLAVFDSHLDADTVSASDFEVNDSQPVDAEVRNVKVRDDVFGTLADGTVDEGSGTGNSAIAGDSVQDVDLDRGYVFLTLSSDLPPNAQPKVEVVGEVADLAGNNQNAGKDDSADDRIAPTLTVSIDQGVRPVTTGKINLTITSDENIGTPKVTFHEVTSSDDEATAMADENEATVKFVSATEYRAEIDAGSDDDGLFTIMVVAADSAGGNTGTAGDAEGEVDVDGITTAILFEHDEDIGEPDVDPDMDGIQDEFEIDDPNAFIRIDFSAEGNEYDDTMEGDDRVGDDLDTHASVTILTATLGGVDITEGLQSNDAGNVFLYKAAGLSLGEHMLEVTAEDEAGNKHASAAEATITITERKPYSLKLNPGWNLVSIPGEPMDAAINTVIPADHPISTVLTRDPFQPGGWLTAIRGPDGMFSGTLTHLSSTRAYWFRTDSFEALSVNIPKQAAGAAQILPTIPIAKGWNLVPILDVDGDFKLEFPTEKGDADGNGEVANDGDASATVNYFSGLTGSDQALGIYAFNTITNGWASVKAQDVEIGKGYWLYATKAGVIIP